MNNQEKTKKRKNWINKKISIEVLDFIEEGKKLIESLYQIEREKIIRPHIKNYWNKVLNKEVNVPIAEYLNNEEYIKSLAKINEDEKIEIAFLENHIKDAQPLTRKKMDCESPEYVGPSVEFQGPKEDDKLILLGTIPSNSIPIIKDSPKKESILDVGLSTKNITTIPLKRNTIGKKR